MASTIQGYVEIIKSDEDSYILRYIRPLDPFLAAEEWHHGMNICAEHTKPKPDIVLMRETEVISEFIHSELQRHPGDLAKSRHPFIIRSVTKPNGHDIYALDGEDRVRIMHAMAEWAETPCVKETILGGQKNGDREWGMDGDESSESSVDFPDALRFGSNGLLSILGFEEFNTPWQPATLMTFNNDAMEALDEVIENADIDDAVRELYEGWVEKFEFCMKQ